jgi:flagellar hook-associated protein 2
LADSAYAQPKLLDRFSQGVVTSITKVVNGKNVQIGLKADLASAGFGIVGTFDQRTSQLNGQLYTLSKRRVTEAAKIEAERSRLLKTYSNLNSLLANMSSTSSFLTAQLASLSKNN